MLSRTEVLVAATAFFPSLPTEFHMSRVFTTIALQSAIAAAVLIVAPIASAGNTTSRMITTDEAHAPVLAPFASSLSRDQVRAEAVAAARTVYTHTDHAHEPVITAQASTLTRAQVHAEAVAANRLGLNISGEYSRQPSVMQLEQIREAGLRAVARENVAAVR
jgi:hypothetical protein